MIHQTDHIARALKAARSHKGLSQRDLAQRTGVPQSHISKIESGGVDLKASSLIEFARALDLELMLVPRRLAPTVEGLQRVAEAETDPALPVPAYRLEDDEDDG